MPLFNVVWMFWNGYEDWQHGMIVPLLAAGIIWLKRDSLAKVPIQGANSGLLVLALALATYWFGTAVDHHYIGFVSAQLLVAGCIIWFLGWAMMKALFFPWLFLAFTWPFLFLDSYLAFPLRMLLSKLAFFFLNGIGLACVQVGSAVISAPDPQLNIPAAERFAIDIADPCSGIRSLFALMMVSALYGYFTMPGMWRKLAIFAAAIPFAIFGNFVRILLLVFGSMMFGNEFAIGTLEDPSAYHMIAGFFVFIVALGAMAALGAALTTDWRQVFASSRRQFFELKAPEPISPQNPESRPVTDLY